MEEKGLTRYLCAAAELDRKFRRDLLDQIVYNNYKFIPPCFGVDLTRIASHSLQARSRDLIGDGIISVSILWCFLSAIDRFGLLGILYAFVSVLLWPLFFSYAIQVFQRIYSMWLVKNKLSKDNFNIEDNDYSNLSPAMLKRIKALEEVKESNVIYYADYSPFVGSGNRISGWSFSAETKLRNTDKDEYIHLNSSDLYTYIDSKMTDLNISTMKLHNGLYVDGSRIRNDKRFLEDEMSIPKNKVDAIDLQDFEAMQDDHIRFFKSVQVTGWESNFIFTTFFRISCSEQNLYLEVQNYLLHPLKKEFYEIDKQNKRIPTAFIIQSLFKSIIPAFISIVKSPANIITWLINLYASSKTNQVKSQIKDNQLFNYGAEKSIREMAAANNLQNFFQKSDVEMYRKKIEQRLFQSIIQYLDEVNVDTSEFKARQETIINNGVMMTGGTLNAQNVAGKMGKINQIFKDAVSS
ncbi:hypothetical protein NSQ20_05135 [Paenibacillus sp. FSL K6-1122]|uniref:hypothetical protein n=1 Tax=Paenibacillus sp. FSL K6-1122 TaxID=2954512 RepID=UPI0030EB9253